MGDGIDETENKLLKLYDLSNIYILKVGHHGSKTSTSESFVESVLPNYAIISAKKSYYNHPHEHVLYITEKMGAIKFNIN